MPFSRRQIGKLTHLLGIFTILTVVQQKAARTRRQPNDERLQVTRHILPQLFEFIAFQYRNFKHLRTLDCRCFLEGMLGSLVINKLFK